MLRLTCCFFLSVFFNCPYLHLLEITRLHACSISFFFLQNSHWALMINKTLPTMRETQSVLVLAESEKDKDNYSLNRQSPWWRPHNQDCMCILGSFHRNAGQAPQKNEEPSNKVDGCRPHQANTVAWVTGGVWTWSLEICMSNLNPSSTAK